MKSALLQKYTNRFYFTYKNGKMTKSSTTDKFLFGKHQIKICSYKEICFLVLFSTYFRGQPLDFWGGGRGEVSVISRGNYIMHHAWGRGALRGREGD